MTRLDSRLFRRKGSLLALLLVLSSGGARGYELETHAVLSGIAFDHSVLTDAQNGPLAHLGVQYVLDRPFKSTAVDPDFPSGTAKSIVTFGARFEDLPNSKLRFLNHFFDPQNLGRGLTTLGLEGKPSPDWELEDRGAIGAQSYSLRDALDFFYLTLVSPDASAREGYLVLLLEAVGRAVHHLQDMAQPAHTRNDPHPPPDLDLYEQATDDLATQRHGELPQESPYPTAAVDLHTFDRARKFWQNDGLGIAELTSGNFVSQDTNFETFGAEFAAAAEFPRPAPNPCEGRSLVTKVNIKDLDLRPKSLAIPGAMWFVGTPVYDHYLSGSEPTLCNPRTSAYGVFDFDLAAMGGPLHLQLNRYTWEQTRAILLPRAIAYSAGLINYFFRGALELATTESGDTLALDVRNVSAGDFALADGARSTTPAEFEVWYEALDGTRKPAQVLSGRDLDGKTIPYGSRHSIQVAKPHDVRPDVPEPYMLVFRGTIGEEEGVIGVAFGPKKAGFAIEADSQAIDGITALRGIMREGAGWKVAPAPVLAGNVDWRGLQQGDLLSWEGPQSRYFYAPGQVDHLSGAIYSGGALLATAPGGVLGAAVRRASPKAPELLAVTYAGGQLSVHARGLIPDAGGAPQWRLVYSGNAPVPLSPAFANASGTEFQFLTVDGLRIKLQVSQDQVSLEQIPARGSGKQTGHISSHTSAEVCGQSTSTDQSYQVSWTVPTVMCADYRGDTEVLCQIDAEPAFSQHEIVHEVLATPDLRDDLQMSQTTSSARVLTVGALRIPLTGSTAVAQGSTHNVYHPFRADPPSINETTTLQAREYATRILYLDARNEVAAFVQTDSVRDYSSTNSGAEFVTGTGYVSHGEITNSTHAENRMVVMHGNQVETLSSTSLPAEVTHTRQQGLIQYSSCPQVPTQDVDIPIEGAIIDDSAMNIMAFVHPNVLQESPQQGFAVDGAGDFAASLRVIRLDSRGAEQTGEVWNFLSDGSLPSLLPSASADPRYFPMGALR